MAKRNAEKEVIIWLNTILGSGWTAYGDRPKVSPTQFVLVDRTGGGREAMVLDRAEILIEVYHKTSREIASDKAQEIADRIPDLKIYSHNTTKAEVNSLIKLDDTITQYNRYQIYCDILVRR